MAPARIPDLEFFGIYDRGIPNRERIVLRVNHAVELTNYGVVLGRRGAGGTILPTPDHFLWLGRSKMLDKGWVFIFTGPGDPEVAVETNTKEPIQAIHWNKPSVVFVDPSITAALIRLGEVQVGGRDKTIAELNQRPELPELPDVVAMSDAELISFLTRSQMERGTTSEAPSEVDDFLAELGRLGNKGPK